VQKANIHEAEFALKDPKMIEYHGKQLIFFNNKNKIFVRDINKKKVFCEGLQHWTCTNMCKKTGLLS
jgi:hypothetical protein